MVQHDETLKNLFSHPEMVSDLLRGFVREEWVRRLDFSTLEKVNTRFVTDQADSREGDITWKVRWGDTWLFILILIEFQSQPDRWMSLRMLAYVSLLYQDLIKQKQIKAHDRLPPVLPIALYNGSREWREPIAFTDLMSEAPRGLERFIPRFEYLLLDESRIPLEEVEKSNLAKALFALERSFTVQEVANIVAALGPFFRAPRNRSLMRAFSVWLNRALLPAHHLEIPPDKLEDFREVQNMLQERVKQWVKQWKAEGLAEGRQQGRQQGRQEGRQESRREIALAMIEQGLNLALIAKVTGMTPEEVDQLAEEASSRRKAPPSETPKTTKVSEPSPAPFKAPRRTTQPKRTTRRRKPTA